MKFTDTISYWKIFLIKFSIMVGISICTSIVQALAGINSWADVGGPSRIIIYATIFINTGNTIVSLIDKSFTRLSDGAAGLASGNGNGNTPIPDNAGQPPIVAIKTPSGSVTEMITKPKQTIGDTLK